MNRAQAAVGLTVFSLWELTLWLMFINTGMNAVNTIIASLPILLPLAGIGAGIAQEMK